MKVVAKANLSGAVGDRVPGEEFTVDAKTADDLVGRGLVEKVEQPKETKPEKTQEKG
jgi:hypothetical protein